MQSRCVIISDGKRGHENQSRVVARMLGDNAPLMMRLRPQVCEGGWNETLLRLRFRFMGTANLDQSSAAGLIKRYLQPEVPGAFRQLAQAVKEQSGALQLVTISTGTPPATFNLAMSRLLKASSICIMTPSLLPQSRFTLNIVPAHDVGAGSTLAENVIATPLALGYHDTAAAELLAGQLAVEHKLDRSARYWGVAVGGPSRACPWAGDCILDELAALHGLAKGMDAQLLVTTSRRTPSHVTAWLKQHYGDSERVPYILDAARDPLNPLPAFYELCERVFITADSFSMLSEAIQAGHKPVVLHVRVGNPPGKLNRALRALSAGGLAVLGSGRAELPERLTKEVPQRSVANVHYDELRRHVLQKLGFE